MSKSFRDLEAFRLAVDLAVMMYDRTAGFPRAEQYGLVAQMRRCAITVISNIAEGQGRITRGEFRQFLSTARGSLYEMDAQCSVAVRLGFMEADTALDRQFRRTNSAVRALLKSLQ